MSATTGTAISSVVEPSVASSQVLETCPKLNWKAAGKRAARSRNKGEKYYTILQKLPLPSLTSPLGEWKMAVCVLLILPCIQLYSSTIRWFDTFMLEQLS